MKEKKRKSKKEKKRKRKVKKGGPTCGEGALESWNCGTC
jgi:hypothetical protein